VLRPPTPELQEKALKWLVGLQAEISAIHYRQVSKSAKKWHWTRDLADHLVPGDFIKLSGPSSAIHEVTSVKRPRPGYVRISTIRKSGQVDSFLMPESRSLLKGVRSC
jgi:hypothetical protein